MVISRTSYFQISYQVSDGLKVVGTNDLLSTSINLATCAAVTKDSLYVHYRFLRMRRWPGMGLRVMKSTPYTTMVDFRVEATG